MAGTIIPKSRSPLVALDTNVLLDLAQDDETVLDCLAKGSCLLLATDGLLKYTAPDRIRAACLQNSPGEAARKLIELVRYPSGALPDDVTVILWPFPI